MPRKHLVAGKNNKKRQLQAKIWQKLAREIKAAVKVGGSNIDANPRLKAAVDKGLQNNLSRESIDRNISGGVKDPTTLEQCEFEVYGPNGMQVIIGALTDNKNRTIANINGYLAKFHGTVAKTNSVKIFFENAGYIVVEKSGTTTLDEILEWTMDYAIRDVNEFEDAFEVKTEPSDFYSVKQVLVDHKCNIVDAEIKLIAQEKITSLDEDTKARYEKFIDSCDEDEDIQWVVTNYEEENE